MFELDDLFKLNKVMVVAEIGINHNGSIDKLYRLVDTAKDAGADAVKFQIFSKDGFYIKGDYLPKEVSSRLPVEIFKKAYIPFEEYDKIFKYAKSLGILPFATPLDIESFEFLQSLNVSVFKVASSDINYIPLLIRISKTNKPVLLSTGFSEIREVKRYAKILANNPLVIMFCVSRYPSQPSDYSIKEFMLFRKEFEDSSKHKLVGFSDHTKTISLPVAFVSLGARVVEKHLTLSEDDDSYDNPVSISSEKFRVMVEMIREVEEAMKTTSRNLPNEFVRKMSMRSLVARRELKIGQRILEDDIEALRPSIFTPSSLENWRKFINNLATKDYHHREPL